VSNHITAADAGVQALNYEAAKEYFFQKLERDRTGRYRMESALYHTAQWIFLQGCAERDRLLARIEELENEVADLPSLAHCAMLSEREFIRAEFEAEIHRKTEAQFEEDRHA
jgi:hypothetical protein